MPRLPSSSSSPQSNPLAGQFPLAKASGASNTVEMPAAQAWVTAFESTPAMRRVSTK